MKIGDRIYVRGYIDEIRKDTVIVRNDGGYFGTIPSEVITGELPFAQPEKRTEERTETHACDLISRQAAIEALKYNQDVYSHNFHDDPIDKYTTAIIAADIDTLVKLPSAQPERKTGKWELLPLSIIPPVYKCSACGRHAVWITTGCLLNRHEESYLSDFCPNCGADMRGEQDERHDL